MGVFPSLCMKINLINSMNKIFLIILLVLGCVVPLEKLYSAEAPVVIVNDLDDSIEELPWHTALNLLDISLLRERSAFTKNIEIISHGTLREIKSMRGHDLENVDVSPGDIVIFAALSNAREAKLRKNAKLDQAFGTIAPVKNLE